MRLASASLREESRDYHKKGQVNVRLTDEGAATLRTLAEFYGVGISSVIEMTVRERVHELGLKVSTFHKPAARKRPHKKSR